MANKIYKVKDKETMESIAKKYRIPAYIIEKENNIKELHAGLRLIIPNIEGIEYVVKPFETLNAVAEKFNIGIDILKRHNKGIEQVFLGQIIYIPYPAKKD